MNKEGYKKTELGYLPLDWDVKKLGYITNNVTIGLVKTMTAHYCEQGVPLIRNSNIKEDKIDKENMVFLTYEFAEANENKRLKVGDIVTVHTGDIGTSAVIEKDMDGAHGFATLNTTVNPEIIYNYYLSKYFNSNMYKKQAISFSTGDGRFNLNLKDFVNSLIPIPPLKEQKKIAEILSSVDAVIEKTEQVIAKTEEVKKGLMQQLLTKGIGHTEFKQTEIGEIPLEWEVVSIESFSTVIRGASPRPKGDPRYYGGNVPRLMGADVTRDKKYVTPKIDFLTEEGAKLSRQMSKGDFVIVCSGTVGLPAILAIDACIHDGFLALKDINPKVSKEYLYYIFTQLRQQLDSKATHGGVFTNLTTQIVKEFKIALPSIDEQENISNILKGIDDKIDLEQKHMDKLSDIKKGLMQQLLTGKTRVKID
ncbi:restriction endonuclease subunit S [Turicibacter sp. KK003]|uniref:restriction endonuclease subunit S n=1 Tax=Turicibacter sp. KK003 TaxID=3114695 RepID=UPI0030CDEF35